MKIEISLNEFDVSLNATDLSVRDNMMIDDLGLRGKESVWFNLRAIEEEGTDIDDMLNTVSSLVLHKLMNMGEDYKRFIHTKDVYSLSAKIVEFYDNDFDYQAFIKDLGHACTVAELNKLVSRVALEFNLKGIYTVLNEYEEALGWSNEK